MGEHGAAEPGTPEWEAMPEQDVMPEQGAMPEQA